MKLSAKLIYNCEILSVYIKTDNCNYFIPVLWFCLKPWQPTGQNFDLKRSYQWLFTVLILWFVRLCYLSETSRTSQSFGWDVQSFCETLISRVLQKLHFRSSHASWLKIEETFLVISDRSMLPRRFCEDMFPW